MTTDDQNPEEHATVTVPIHVCWNDSEAQIVISILRENGIEAFSNSEVPHSVLPVTADGLGKVEVMVEEHEADKARQLLKDYQNSAKEGEDNA